ncbi:MAG: hypothetical protein OHK0029_35660 [Armatimonadaceae bacterium]
MKRILIVKMWALGDILMATPLLTALRQAHPDVHITWVVDESHGEILRGIRVLTIWWFCIRASGDG